MRTGGERIGPWGLSLLAVAGLVGLTLGAYGYAQGMPAAAGSASLPSPHPAAASGAARHTGSQGHGAGTSTTQPPTSTSAMTHQKLGPLLSSTQYASYAYRLYPGVRSTQARLATAGYTVEVTPGPSTITVRVSAAGGGQGAQTSSYPAGDRVYFVEASFGDDSGDAEYNTGDDGLIVTNNAGRIVQ